MNAKRKAEPLANDQPTELVRRRISSVLEEAGAAGIAPTPLDQVAAVAGISEVLDIKEFNAVQRETHRRKRTPGVSLKRFVGAVFFRPRVVLVDTTRPESMQRWTEAHELSHKILPWHELNSYVDPLETLSPDAKEQQEREANIGAAELLFQGQHFWDRCLDYRQGLGVPIALAEDFATSLTSTIRYFVDTHPEPMGLVCAAAGVQNGRCRILYGLQSPAFLAEYGEAISHFPSAGIPASTRIETSSLVDAVRHTRQNREVTHGALQSADINGEDVRFDLETFFNGYTTFVVLHPHRRIQLGRRLRVASTM